MQRNAHRQPNRYDRTHKLFPAAARGYNAPMKRRLFNILTVFSLLLGMATGGLWVRSYSCQDGIIWRSNLEGYGFRVCSWRGEIYIMEFASLGNSFFNRYASPVENEEEIPWFVYDVSFLGFHYGSDADRIHGPGGAQYVVGIPFWFLTAVLALVTVYVWRRTGRAKPNRAFPVELDKAGA